MEGNNFYDSSSIAAQSKREQFMKEAEEYRLQRHIAALRKLEKGDKKASLEKTRKYRIPLFAKPHPKTAH